MTTIRKLKSSMESVRAEIEADLAREHSDLSHFGRGLQREGFVGGYLEALRDVFAMIDGYSNVNSRFASYWSKSNKNKP